MWILMSKSDIDDWMSCFGGDRIVNGKVNMESEIYGKLLQVTVEK